jgi:hypothetical protein
MWRRVYFLLILVRVYFALSPSYLHPDENFQGPEVIAGMSTMCAETRDSQQLTRCQDASSPTPSTKHGSSPQRTPSAAPSRYGSHTAGPCTFCAGSGRDSAMRSRRQSSTGRCACSCSHSVLSWRIGRSMSWSSLRALAASQCRWSRLRT